MSGAAQQQRKRSQLLSLIPVLDQRRLSQRQGPRIRQAQQRRLHRPSGCRRCRSAPGSRCRRACQGYSLARLAIWQQSWRPALHPCGMTTLCHHRRSLRSQGLRSMLRKSTAASPKWLQRLSRRAAVRLRRSTPAACRRRSAAGLQRRRAVHPRWLRLLRLLL